MAEDKKKKEGGEAKGGEAKAKAKAPAGKPEGEAKKKPEGAAAKGEGKKGEGKKGDKGKSASAAPPAEGNGNFKRSEPPRLKTVYDKDVAPQLMKTFGYKNKMQVPKIVKISINMGMGEALQNPKLLDSAVDELTAIAGQKPIVTRAKKSIATFKLREGQKIGVMVTLRREKMWEFFDRLVSLALPRVRDFKGVSPRAFDGRGNYSLGVKEQIIFPEINYDKIDKIKGLNISIVTTARTDEEGRTLLKSLGMPFRS